MNRKLIRPNLADIKNQERDSQKKRESSGQGEAARRQGSFASDNTKTERKAVESNESLPPASSKNRRPLPIETNAEIFYYKKQIDVHTLMIIVLQDGEEITGTIEWYDRNALKINRKDAPNILLLKHNIKYMFKAEDRERQQP